ncbi:hypothetical protein [Methanolobus sp.]|jgi:hypothetical protein|uniref:hypothetical protein n=1 Tax=Methanolobus sp. TaxID=1874737 RepID=UPI0025DE6602|nr:hypothetical protein [Methanolobus sp.]
MTQRNQAYSPKSQPSSQRINGDTSDDIIEMRVPMSMVDFQFMGAFIATIIAFIIISLIDHLYRGIWTYLSVVLIYGMMLTAFYLMSRHEISLYNGSVFVKKPFFREVKISAERINGEVSYNNSVYKYRKSYYSIMSFIILLFTIMYLSDSYRMIGSYGIYNSINIAISIFPTILFTMLFYNAHQASHYPKAIKLDINPGEIKLYPENEQKYLLLKERLDCLLR